MGSEDMFELKVGDMSLVFMGGGTWKKIELCHKRAKPGAVCANLTRIQRLVQET